MASWLPLSMRCRSTDSLLVLGAHVQFSHPLMSVEFSVDRIRTDFDVSKYRNQRNQRNINAVIHYTYMYAYKSHTDLSADLSAYKSRLDQ